MNFNFFYFLQVICLIVGPTGLGGQLATSRLSWVGICSHESYGILAIQSSKLAIIPTMFTGKHVK